MLSQKVFIFLFLPFSNSSRNQFFIVIYNTKTATPYTHTMLNLAHRKKSILTIMAFIWMSLTFRPAGDIHVSDPDFI